LRRDQPVFSAGFADATEKQRLGIAPGAYRADFLEPRVEIVRRIAGRIVAELIGRKNASLAVQCAMQMPGELRSGGGPARRCHGGQVEKEACSLVVLIRDRAYEAVDRPGRGGSPERIRSGCLLRSIRGLTVLRRLCTGRCADPGEGDRDDETKQTKATRDAAASARQLFAGAMTHPASTVPGLAG